MPCIRKEKEDAVNEVDPAPQAEEKQRFSPILLRLLYIVKRNGIFQGLI